MYNIVELFSGIGSQAKALKNIGMKIGDVYTCEWDIHAFVAYDAIHNSLELPKDVMEMEKEELILKLQHFELSNNGKEAMDVKMLQRYSTPALRRIYGAILKCNNFVNVSTLSGDKIPENIDILTYSFPCQDLSNVGAFHGYNKGIGKDSGSRSSLLWQVGRVLEEMDQQRKSLPRFLLMENVPTLLSARHLPLFNEWIKDLERLGYISKYFHLNASDFGLPQNRPRLLMVSVFVGKDQEKRKIVEGYFKKKTEADVVADYKATEFYRKIEISELLRNKYYIPSLFKEACECTPNDTPSRRKIWNENPQLVLEGNKINSEYKVIRTITTKQDRHPNSGNLYFDSGIEGKGKFRYLTPRECFLFMGFTDQDYDRILRNNVKMYNNKDFFLRDKLIRMAGNSIPVKLLEGVFWQVKIIDDLIK